MHNTLEVGVIRLQIEVDAGRADRRQSSNPCGRVSAAAAMLNGSPCNVKMMAAAGQRRACGDS